MPGADSPGRREIAVGTDPERDAVRLDADELFGLLTPQTVELLRTIAREQPGSIRETARLVDRDIKNVHRELIRLGARDLVGFEEDGRARRPVLAYDTLAIELAIGRGTRRGSDDRGGS